MLYQLEDRILFDGAAVADVASAEQQAREAEEAARQQADNEAQDAQKENQAADANAEAADGRNEQSELLQTLAAAGPFRASGGSGFDVLFIDKNVARYDFLANAAEKDGTLVIEYDSTKTNSAGLSKQLTDLLTAANATEINRLGIICNVDANGALSIVSDSKTDATTVGSQTIWSDIKAHMTADGQIDIFASNAASKLESVNILKAIAKATDSDVFASTDITGDSDVPYEHGTDPANWTLEYGVDASGNVLLDPTSTENEGLTADVRDYFDTALLDSYDDTVRELRQL
ncbi:MAG: DUF4347 domain-containing protein, partial [Victivallaceae bacterium]